MEIYKELLAEIKAKIPADEYNAVMNQIMCEYEHDFLGFLEVYKAASMVAPKCSTIIDFGCYLAAQAYFFSEHSKYIGVDVVDLQRFAPENAEHYIGTIQDYIKEHPETATDPNVFAVCSYVPDFKAQELVRKTYGNCLVYYPTAHRRIAIGNDK